MSIDKQTVLGMNLEDILKAVKDPATSQAMQRILPDREVAKYVSGLMIAKQNALEAKEVQVTQGLASVTVPSTEALAAEAQAMVEEEVVPAQSEPVTPPVSQPVDTAAEDAALKAIGVTAQRDAQGKVTQVVIEYQVVDEENRPIGRPTRLWAPTLIELLGKVRNAHENATRAFHRLKVQKLTFEKREQDRLLSVDEMKAIATKALESKDANEAEKIVRNLIATEFAKKEEELKDQREHEAGVSIGNAFLRNHIEDFYVCEANNKALGTYLKEHRLEFTLDNLEAAFLDLKETPGGLVDRPAKGSTAKSADPAPNASDTAIGDTNVQASTATPAGSNQPAAAASTPQSASAPVTQPAAAQASVASQPGNEATVATPATANTPRVARRPVVSGVMPGTLSAQRPGAPDPALARKEFMKMIRDMDPKLMSARLKNDPQFVKQCEAYGIRTR